VERADRLPPNAAALGPYHRGPVIRLRGTRKRSCRSPLSQNHGNKSQAEIHQKTPDASHRFDQFAAVGDGTKVSDAELVAGIRLLAEEAGIFTETAGGVTVAAALALAAEGRFSPDDEVVLCITGNGLKTIDAVAPVLPPAPLIAPRVAEVRALVKADAS